ncbi:MAG: hypothetical protein NT010_01875 [Proteobacteria bacterium]|nr:hypothetical protein [Pseudomonadota bacterium]
MSNAFVEIIKTAHIHNWCTMPYCSTCYAHDYRQALKQLEGKLGGGLAEALATLNPSELTKEHDWKGALHIAIMDLPYPLQLEEILKAWWPKFYEDIEFSDFVLYKILRYVPKKSDIRKNWIDNCIVLAKENKSFSLIESLLLVLRKTAFEHTELIEIAKEYAKSSDQMRRVLRNACGIELKNADCGKRRLLPVNRVSGIQSNKEGEETMANTREYRNIELACLSEFYEKQELTKVTVKSADQRKLFGKMELDIIGYSEKDKTLFLGEFTASGYFGLNGKDHHIGANRKLAESFLKLYICKQKEGEIRKYFREYQIDKIRYIFAVPKGALFLNGLTYQKEVFSLSFLELKQIDINSESKNRLEQSYMSARTENKK